MGEEAVAAALAAHNDERRFELDDERHGALMLAADLVEWGWKRGINMSSLFAEAADLAAEAARDR